MKAIPIFIGFDPREAAAYHTCVQSIIETATQPVAIVPLALNTLKGYTETHKDGSNAFIYSRFLVPYLCRWTGHAIYLDGDMLVREDIGNLWALRRFDVGAQVVQHDYRTKYQSKYLSNVNENYRRKNWSSVVLWNCNFFPNRVLTPEYVGDATGSHLHQFDWLDDEQIGKLPPRWNHLTMEYDEMPDAALYHYTVGIPGFPEFADQEGAGEWKRTYTNAQAPIGGPASAG